MSLSSVILRALILLFLTTTSRILWIYFRSPIKNIPGPFAAKFTHLWRFLNVCGGRAELNEQKLHEQYGPAVRIGPNVVSLSDPKLIRTIYNTRGDFLKSNFYASNDTKVGSLIIQNMFSTRSNDLHAQFIRPISKFYKMSSILAAEPLVNQTIASFFKRLDEEFVDGINAERTCDIGDWLLYFAWDVINQLTFGKPMGFMDEGGDSLGILATAEKAMDYFAVVGQIPVLDKWLAKNPVWPLGPPTFDPVAKFCAQQLKDREQGVDGNGAGRGDMLDGFLAARKTDPDALTDVVVIGAMLVNVLAGADTTAILLRAIIYFVLKNPQVHVRLQNALDEAAAAGDPVSYARAERLPYLDAVIRESARMHPSVGLILERVVPPGNGLVLPDGTIIPSGTIVGMNSYVVNRNKVVFGPDAASFNPDRWLRAEDEAEDVYEARILEMKHADLTFGAGNRGCIGKNISILESYKVIAALFLRYDMRLVDPTKDWKVKNFWFVRQTGIGIKIRHRLPRRHHGVSSGWEP